MKKFPIIAFFTLALTLTYNQLNTAAAQPEKPVSAAENKAVEDALTKKLDAYLAAQAKVREAEEKHYSALEIQRLKDVAELERTDVKSYWDKISPQLSFSVKFLLTNLPNLVRTSLLYIGYASDFAAVISPEYGLATKLGAWMTIRALKGANLAFEFGLRKLLPVQEDYSTLSKELERIKNPVIVLPPSKEVPLHFASILEAAEAIVVAKRQVDLAKLADDMTWKVWRYGEVQTKFAIAKEHFNNVLKEATQTIGALTRKSIENKALQDLAFYVEFYKIQLRFVEVAIEVTTKRYNEWYKPSWNLLYKNTEFLREPRDVYMRAVERRKALAKLVDSIDVAQLSDADKTEYTLVMQEIRLADALKTRVLEAVNAFAQFTSEKNGPQ